MKIDKEIKSLKKQLRDLQKKLETIQESLNAKSLPKVDTIANKNPKKRLEDRKTPAERTSLSDQTTNLKTTKSEKQSDSDPKAKRKMNATSSRNNQPIASITKSNQKPSRLITTSHTQDRRTLRSRSFKVMRHLINMVDDSQAETFLPKSQESSPNRRESSSEPVRSKTETKIKNRSSEVAKPPDESIELYRYRSIPKYTKIYRSKSKPEGFKQLAENNNISVKDIIQLYIPKVPTPNKKELYYYSGYATKHHNNYSVPDLSIVPCKIRKKLQDPSFAWMKNRWCLLSRPEP
ncbi:uncharacterized protein PGTG_22784 [Puccinia graminis f. sp. tritici CRL 75-36-700-3]|uniref:Uncharacterized protein n=1 Tax=Puccinia graminis f. sp. tritici (strain CRL 75-36-700-3 / race SCCL) TaxID=418459 RepID=H6QVL4_PUCGT|nr:uncharacterized protein PGTG_22784 [Puccinia graminis f. sp. tritici CRL 75-36-700-3]EHS63270.1 hypothetical protein PGTG_22784 [Puccinia graminis f. sp. tritici CRL 75-36-700-3]